MSEAKRAQDMGRNFSGDAGYCQYTRSGRGVQVEWDGATVVSVQCEHEICGYAKVCKIYKRHPVGFVQTYPQQEKPEA